MTEGKSCSANKTETCSSETKCCPKKFLFTAIAIFAINFVFDWLVHGILLMDQYTATASLWRPEAEMAAMMPLCIAKHALMALVFATLFMAWKKQQSFGALGSCSCPLRKGFCFGATIGLLLGINAASAYLWQPIPQSLAIAWGVAETVKWGLAAGIVSLLCHRCSKK